MPWINKEMCMGCGICVNECPVGIISMEDNAAVIEMGGCIRCGICHTACPVNAVRHDSEKAPERVGANLKEVKEFMDACEEKLGDESERLKCLKRMVKHYNNEKRIAEETLENLNSLKDKLNSAKKIK